jgi:ribonuclease VapC
MMIETSALTAILLNEPEALRLVNAISVCPTRRLPSSCLFEASIIQLGRKGDDGLRNLDLFLARARIEVVPFTESHAGIAREAFRRFGKGRHPAGLNFGDCMAYALAKETGEELLFKGTDFALTDIAVASY